MQREPALPISTHRNLFQDSAPRSAMFPAPCCPGFQMMTEEAWSRSTVMAVQHEVFQHDFPGTGRAVVNAVQAPQGGQRAFSVLHGLGRFFPERYVVQPVYAAFGQVADGKVVVKGFRELAGLHAGGGFQLHGQRAAQRPEDGVLRLFPGLLWLPGGTPALGRLFPAAVAHIHFTSPRGLHVRACSAAVDLSRFV